MTEHSESEGCPAGDAGGGAAGGGAAGGGGVTAVAGTAGKLVMTAAPFVALLALLLVHRCLSP